MRIAILAGGLGTRHSEETGTRKDHDRHRRMPILWHVVKGYAADGVQTFVVALG